MRIKVLVADDQTLFRTMLEGILKLDQEIEIVASVSNGYDAVQQTKALKPDIALLDIQMPGKTGVEALSEIKEQCPETKVVMLTTFEDVESITASCNAGADGYLVKDMKPEIVVMAIKCIYHNIVLIHQGAYSVIFPSKGCRGGKAEGRVQFGDLSFDHIDIIIMKQLAEGRTNKEIAQILNYSEGTVKNRVSNLLNITGLSDRTQISVFAIKNNLI